jgi:hypothetical protein
MADEISQKSWFHRHWIISSFLGILIFLYVMGAIGIFGNSSSTTGNVVANSPNSNLPATNLQVSSSDTNPPTQTPTPSVCIPDWSCGSWSECSNDGKQTRTCEDENSCGGLSGKPSETQSCMPALTTWHQIITFSGNGIKNTETFNIPSSEWRISWDTQEGEYGAMNFVVFVYKEDGTMSGLAANVIGTDKDSSIMRGAGNYYLTINTAQPYDIIIDAKY